MYSSPRNMDPKLLSMFPSYYGPMPLVLYTAFCILLTMSCPTINFHRLKLYQPDQPFSCSASSICLSQTSEGSRKSLGSKGKDRTAHNSLGWDEELGLLLIVIVMLLDIQVVIRQLWL